MAQVLTTTSDASMSPNATTLAASIATLRTRFVSGQPIAAADVTSIISIWNTWVNHDHTVADQLYLAFGALPAYPTTTETRVSAVVKGQTTSSTTYTVGQNINASHQQFVAGIVNNIRSHTHDIVDKQLP